MSEAMSDETNEQAQAPAEGEVQEQAVTETPEQQEGAEKTEGQTEGETQETETAEGEDDGDKPRKRSGLTRLKAQQRLLQAENAELRSRLASQPPMGAGDEQDKAPKEEDFNGDWQAFQDAKAAHAARQAVREEFRRDRDSKRAETEQNELRERVLEHEERVEEARKVIKDFDKVIKSAAGIKINEPLARQVLLSEKSELLQYHLAKNQEQLHELNGMSEIRLAKEIGRLEATLKLPDAKKQTTAPAPLARLSGGAAAPFNAEKASMSEYAKDYERRMKAGG